MGTFTTSRHPAACAARSTTAVADMPSFQASPKFGIFMCLNCSGIHRGLGVHISFIRSITMDAFKGAELERMKDGGNKPWQDFFNKHESNQLEGRTFDDCTINERYDSEAGEEWKERLTCKVEGTEYVPGATKKTSIAKPATGVTPAGSGRNTPLQSVRSPPQRNASPSQKSRNEAYFASKGAENEARPEGVAPSQGGKYGGFGSSPMPTQSSGGNNNAMPNGDDFQSDPVAALTKGFGWLSSTVTKQAANVNKSFIQPGMKSIEDGTFASQARNVGMQAGGFVQQGVRQANDQFSRFVDPDQPSGSGPAMSGQRTQPAKKDFWDSFGEAPAGPPKEKQSFWDDFNDAGESRMASQQPKPTSIGTSAMKTGAGGSAQGKKEDDGGWGDW